MSLLSLVGAPSPRFYAMLDVIRALTQIALGDHLVVCANSFDALRASFPSPADRAGRALVLSSDYPQPDMLATFNNAGAPLAVCLDDFTAIAHFSVVTRDYGGVEAARFASMALVNLEPWCRIRRNCRPSSSMAMPA